jgi:hypothetical protein
VTLRPKRNIRSITGSIDDSAESSTYRTHAAICLTVRQGSRQNRCCISVFKTANATAEAAFNVFPHPLDHPHCCDEVSYRCKHPNLLQGSNGQKPRPVEPKDLTLPTPVAIGAIPPQSVWTANIQLPGEPLDLIESRPVENLKTSMTAPTHFWEMRERRPPLAGVSLRTPGSLPCISFPICH